jgi:hypothetical protein
MAGCVHNTDPRTQTTFYVVEPLFLGGAGLALMASLVSVDGGY